KIDFRRLPEPEITRDAAYVAPRSATEKALEQIFGTVLNLERIGIHDNFFELGGNSLLLVRVRTLIQRQLHHRLEMTDLFHYPTIARLAEILDGAPNAARQRTAQAISAAPADAAEAVAIIGMAGHFPGASTPDEFWENLAAGVESIRFYNEEELLASGFTREIARHPRFVPAYGQLDGVALFDANFFHMTPREAELCDPQQRHLLEIAWETLESAGCDPAAYEGRVGVFVGVGSNAYFEENLLPALGHTDVATNFQISLLNGKEFVATRISYKLDLDGPSLNVNTTCSTSLVAVHLAARAVLEGQCELALAGGARIQTGGATGYLYHEGFILSPDGHCRAFDSSAAGTVGGSGAGLVALKKLSAAMKEGDPILAVIRGSAVNNDGADKVGFTAPGVHGQTEVIRQALRTSGVDPSSIGYLEAHGTGTALGDPIEIRALTNAFGAVEPGRCAIGSVKTNIGHLDAASGVAGLIKTVKALEHGQIPPSLHFKSPNPAIDFAHSPFFVASQLIPWRRGRTPRRAGVSSFGIGGTNAHVILEEAPLLLSDPPRRTRLLLPFSAHTESALSRMADNLAAFIEHHPEVNPDDLAYTLACGRRTFGARGALVCADLREAALQLRRRKFTRSVTGLRQTETLWLFTGQGAELAGAGQVLYQQEPAFREALETCRALLRPHFDLLHVLWPEKRRTREASPVDTRFIQPTLFALEYALGALWQSWGVTPKAMLGHSLGEWTAACLASVFTLEDALKLVRLRGELMAAQGKGAMLVVPLTLKETMLLLSEGMSLAAENARNQCVISGKMEVVERLENELKTAGRQTHRLPVAHAFHSPLMREAVAPFREALQQITMHPPKIPFVSSLTGTWILDEQATSPDYWARQIVRPVLFHRALETLLTSAPEAAVLEIGPGAVLARLTARHPANAGKAPVTASLANGREEEDEYRSLLEAAGTLWSSGVPINWRAFYAGDRRRKIPLPTYPFERRKYWIEPGKTAVTPDLPHVSEIISPENAPRSASEAERQVLELMREILGVSLLSAEDDFFKVGGDSLTAVQLAARLEERFGVTVPRHALLTGATAAQLARMLPKGALAQEIPQALPENRESTAQGPESIVGGTSASGFITLRKGDASSTPLVFIPAIGGGAFIYRELAIQLETPHPIHAFEAP
ncbi:MAG: acyltransferase domain-containing protein, partial [Deltaproteobacteria bacterium]|nr:acyltransferase domain-containing protein [Deltaproteobacteria bacterium]